MEHYRFDTKYKLVESTRKSTGEKMMVFKPINGVVLEGGFDAAEDINSQHYNHPRDIHLDAAHTLINQGVPREQLRKD